LRCIVDLRGVGYVFPLSDLLEYVVRINSLSCCELPLNCIWAAKTIESAVVELLPFLHELDNVSGSCGLSVDVLVGLGSLTIGLASLSRAAADAATCVLKFLRTLARG